MPAAPKIPALLVLKYSDDSSDRFGNLTAEEVAWFRQRQAARAPVPAKPVPTPAPAPKPVPAAPMSAMPTRVADHTKADRGDGLQILKRGNESFGPGKIDGYNQNIVVLDSDGATITGFRSLRAYWNGKDKFQGQGLFVDRSKNVTVTDSFFYQNGWQPLRPPARRNMYCHSCYFAWQAPDATVKRSILWGSSNCGVQFKAGGRIEDSLIIDNGTGIQAILDKCEVVRCTIYDGHHWYSPEGAHGAGKEMVDCWTGMTAVQTYCPTHIEDTWIIGAQGQETPTLENGWPVLRDFDMGAVSGSSKYNDDHFKGQPGASFTFAGDCRFYGWPGTSYSLDNKPLAPPANYHVSTVKAPRIDLTKLREDCLSGTRPIGDLAAEWSAKIRALVA